MIHYFQIELIKVYHKIPVASEDITVIMTPFGLFKFLCCMPFDLQNAVQMKHYAYRLVFCFTYCNDILSLEEKGIVIDETRSLISMSEL